MNLLPFGKFYDCNFVQQNDTHTTSLMPQFFWFQNGVSKLNESSGCAKFNKYRVYQQNGIRMISLTI